jgi:hypothetical protein
MKRHPFDPFSFIFGVAFLVLAGGLSMNKLDLDGGVLSWFGAAMLLLLGIVLMLTSRSSSDRS